MLDSIHARLEHTLGSDGVRRLHRASVAVIGAGLLGGQLLHHLAMLQIRTLILDDGSVDSANLGNQMLPAASIGKPKAQIRVQQMAQLNPSCPTRAIVARVEEVGLGVFADCDLLLTGLDSRASRLFVNRIAQRLGIDWIDSAVDGSGERLLGTVSWFRPAAPAHACYGCRFDAAELGALGRRLRRQPCASWRAPEALDAPPTLTASPFGSVVSGWQMAWAVPALLGRDDGLVGQQLQISGTGTSRSRMVELTRMRGCAFPHHRLAPLRRVHDVTVGALLETAERDLGKPPEGLTLPDRTLVFGLACPACGSHLEWIRCAHAVTDAELHCDCGAERVPLELGHHLNSARARRVATLEWGDLGVPDQDVVTATGPGGQEIHYLLPPGAQEEGV